MATVSDPQLALRRDFRAFDILNFYRYPSALAVALAHYTTYFPLGKDFSASLFGSLHPFMGFFFTLSGFVIMHVYDGRITSLAKYGNYVRRRLARIYPIFILTFAMSYFYAAVTHNHSDMFATSAILPNLLLIHAWNTTKMLTFDYPSWSVSAEMFVYLLFPAFLFMVNRLGAFAFALPIVLGLATMAVFAIFGLGDWLAASFNGGCLRAVPSFVAGMVVQRLATRELAGFRAPVWLAHVMAAGAIALLLGGAPGALVLVYLAALVFVMVAAEPERPGILSRPLARYLAGASYGFYLLHVPVADVLLRSLPHHFGWSVKATYALTPVALVVTTLLSIVSFQYFEEPLRRYIGAPLRRSSILPGFSSSIKQIFRDAH